MDAAWESLYNEAKKVLAPRRISEWMEAGGVAAAIVFGALNAAIFTPKTKK